MKNNYFLYDGILNDDERSWIRGMMNKYPYALELEGKFPAKEFIDLFSDRTYTKTGEDCMGNIRTTIPQKGILYGTIGHRFLFLPDKDSYDKFIVNFYNIIKSTNPFKSVF